MQAYVNNNNKIRFIQTAGKRMQVQKSFIQEMQLRAGNPDGAVLGYSQSGYHGSAGAKFDWR